MVTVQLQRQMMPQYKNVVISSLTVMASIGYLAKMEVAAYACDLYSAQHFEFQSTLLPLSLLLYYYVLGEAYADIFGPIIGPNIIQSL